MSRVLLIFHIFFKVGLYGHVMWSKGLALYFNAINVVYSMVALEFVYLRPE